MLKITFLGRRAFSRRSMTIESRIGAVLGRSVNLDPYFEQGVRPKKRVFIGATRSSANSSHPEG